MAAVLATSRRRRIREGRPRSRPPRRHDPRGAPLSWPGCGEARSAPSAGPTCRRRGHPEPTNQGGRGRRDIRFVKGGVGRLIPDLQGRGRARPAAPRARIVGQLPRVRGRTPGLPPRGVRPCRRRCAACRPRARLPNPGQPRVSEGAGDVRAPPGTGVPGIVPDRCAASARWADPAIRGNEPAFFIQQGAVMRDSPPQPSSGLAPSGNHRAGAQY